MSGIQNLIEKGRKTGFLNKSEILEALPKTISEAEDINIILDMIKDMGIEIKESSLYT